MVLSCHVVPLFTVLTRLELAQVDSSRERVRMLVSGLADPPMLVNVVQKSWRGPMLTAHRMKLFSFQSLTP